jgi:hypothetical protein
MPFEFRLEVIKLVASHRLVEANLARAHTLEHCTSASSLDYLNNPDARDVSVFINILRLAAHSTPTSSKR